MFDAFGPRTVVAAFKIPRESASETSLAANKEQHAMAKSAMARVTVSTAIDPNGVSHVINRLAERLGIRGASNLKLLHKGIGDAAAAPGGPLKVLGPHDYYHQLNNAKGEDIGKIVFSKLQSGGHTIPTVLGPGMRTSARPLSESTLTPAELAEFKSILKERVNSAIRASRLGRL